jgi:type IV pilus assembly protein PilY1
MLSIIRNLTLSLCAVSAVLSTAHAVVAQDPLLTRTSSAPPNLVLMFDDSASMPAQFVYQFGGSQGVFGRVGPGSAGLSASCPGTPSIASTCTYSAPASTRYYELSPDVNRLYYDPRILYKVRITSAGTFSTAGAVTTDAFNVYFYKDTSGTNLAWPGTGPDPTLLASYFGPYTPPGTMLVSGATTGLSYPQSVATGTGPFPRFLGRTDCNSGATTGGSCSLTEERQNYANWKKYHSNRLDLAKTGLGYAFETLGPTLRVGWGVINTLDGGSLDSGVGLFTASRKDAFYNWLYARKGDIGGTPNRLALKTVGNYFSRQDNRGPWALSPDTSSIGSSTLATSSSDSLAVRGAHASCRRSFSMLVTDGYYNDASPAVGQVDGTSSPNITGTSIQGAALSFTYNGTDLPFADAFSDTLADVAMKYWITDLRPDLPNRVNKIPDTVVDSVVTAKGNESFWQNMSFYGVSLGVYGTLPQTSTTLAGLTAWPSPSGNNETAMDDMWHATVNARGQLLSAKNADELSAAVQKMLASIARATSTQSGSWTGNVVARNVDPDTGKELTTAWQVVGVGTTSAGGTATVAYSGIPAHASRNIVTWSGSAGIPFANTAAVTGSMTAPVTAELIDYLRGDQANEGSAGQELYRTR